jgi:membrane protease YdiL (CAAX protease family)
MPESPVVLPPPAPLPPWLRPVLLRSWTEFVIVAALLMALPIRSSTSAALQGSSGDFVQLLLTNNHLLGTIFVEATVLSVFLFYLHWRGWRPTDFRLKIGVLSSVQGIGLLLAAYLAAVATLFVVIGLAYAFNATSHFTSFLAKISPHITRHSIHVSWGVVIVSMVVNAFMEELVCMGYIFNQLAARWGPAAALVVTVFLRAACHTYQDPIHLAGIVVLFSVFGAGYWYLRKLWPLVFAHMLLDIGSVSAIKLLFG